MKILYLFLVTSLTFCTKSNVSEGLYLPTNIPEDHWEQPTPIIIFKEKVFFFDTWSPILSSDTLINTYFTLLLRLDESTLAYSKNNVIESGKAIILYKLNKSINRLDTTNNKTFNHFSLSYRFQNSHASYSDYFDLDVDLTNRFTFYNYVYLFPLDKNYERQYSDTLVYTHIGSDTQLYSDVLTLMNLVEFPNEINEIGTGYYHYGTSGYSYLIQDYVEISRGLIEYEFLSDVDYYHPVVPIMEWLKDYYRNTVVVDTLNYRQEKVEKIRVPKSRNGFWRK